MLAYKLAKANYSPACFLYKPVLLGLIGGTLGATAGWYASNLINQRIADILQTQGLPAVELATAPLWLCGGSIILAISFALLAGLYPAMAGCSSGPV